MYLSEYKKQVLFLCEDGSNFDTTTTVDVTRERPFSGVELEQAYEMLGGDRAGNCTYEDIQNIVAERVVDWPRGKNSLRLLLIRMYGLMFGEVPDGVTPSVDWYSVTTKSLLDFLEEKGYDVVQHYHAVMDDARVKIEDKKKRKTRDEALAAMSAYFKEIKASLDKNKLTKLQASREAIINKIMGGTSAADSFAEVM